MDVDDSTSSRTARLLVLTSVCSAVFLLGTALHTFWVVDTGLIEDVMRRAGVADPAGDAPGFLRGFRIVGCGYVLANALGVLAWRSRAAWLFRVVVVVNLSQGLGVVLVPPELWAVARERYGVAGLLPALVTDGGAALLTIVLLATSVRGHGPWAQRWRPGA